MTDFSDYAVTGDSAARRIVAPDQIDRLAEALLALTGEVWILTDRLTVLEAVLTEKGLDVATAVDRHTPSPALEKTLDAKRDKLIANVLAALGT